MRKAKSEAKLSMRTDVATVVIGADNDSVTLLEGAADDLKSAGRIADLQFDSGSGDALSVQVTL